MSLLIKALEQAAKDRKAGRVEPGGKSAPAPAETAATGARAGVNAQPAPSPASSEPTLEPLEPPPRGGASARAPRTEQVPAHAPVARTAPAGASPGAGTSAAAERPPAPRRATTSLSELQENDARQQRARAAAVVQAGGGSASQAITFLRANPVIMIGAVAVFVGLVFGIYVYLQIANPGLFTRQVATRPAVTPAPAPAAPAPGLPETATPGGTAIAIAPADIAPVAPDAAAAGAIAVPPAATTAPPGQIPAAAVIARAPPQDLARASAPEGSPERAPERPAEPRATRGSVQSPEPPRSAPARAAVPATPIAAAEPAARERINVSPGGTQPTLNPTLSQAYELMQSGRLDEARALYARISQSEPLNVDAVLGLAYIAAQENRGDDAMKHYLRILQLNPRHAVAQAALIGLMGRADPTASESRLKQLIAREPSPFLHFVLGNLYADQSLWPQAQQAYFQAHHLEPDNPDYAYNLAIGLDHLRQAKLALNFYRRADELAAVRGRSNFDLSHARERIRTLSSQLE